MTPYERLLASQEVFSKELESTIGSLMMIRWFYNKTLPLLLSRKLSTQKQTSLQLILERGRLKLLESIEVSVNLVKL